MNEKANILKVYRHEKPETTSMLFAAVRLCGIITSNESGRRGKEVRPGITLDCFGVEWDQMHGQPTPYTGNFILDDICNWREKVTIPDVENWDWNELAANDPMLKGYDRDEQALLFFDEAGAFDRLTHVLGFENALISLSIEPEECRAFADAIADYKIKKIKCVKEAYDPDIYMYSDDIAKADGLFMHPDAYREVFKPGQTRIMKAIHDLGMISQQHTCGKCEEVMEDYVEAGVDCFFPAQASNDIPKLQELYGDKIVFCGGFDSQGPAARSDATEETMRAEARRCVHDYAIGGSYICLPIIMTSVSADVGDARRMRWFADEFYKECAKMGV